MPEKNSRQLKKILISFLGAGNYQEVTYHYNGKSYLSKLALEPIKSIYQPEKIYIIGTNDSKWELVNKYSFEKIKIPTGKSSDEFWEIFSALCQKTSIKNSQIAFDITHCFRSIPFFVVIFIQFIKFIEKSAEIKHIFYGYLDSESKESTIIDLKPITELLDWMEAVSSLQKYGDLSELSQLLNKKYKNIRTNKDDNLYFKGLKKLSNNLEKLNKITKMTYVPQLGDIAETLSEIISNPQLKEVIRNYLKPLEIIMPQLENLSKRFKKKSVWESLIEVTKWYIDKNNPTQALLVLRETIVTYIAEQKGVDAYDKNQRDIIEKELNDNRKSSPEPIHKLWNKIIDARNNVAHALMKRTDLKIKPDKALNKVRELLEETQEVLIKGDYNDC